MADYVVSDTTLTSIANAIRTAGSTSASIEFPAGFITAIGNISGGGGDIKISTGSVVSDGTRDLSFSVEFEPDIVVVNCNALDFETAGWTGAKNVVIIKNQISYMSRHNSDTAVTPLASITDNLGGSYPPYGETTGNSYYEYGTYTNGVFKISNTNNAPLTKFVNGQTYSWTAIKYTNST